MGYRSNVRMVVHGPKKIILAGFGALALTGDATMHECLTEWAITEDGVQKGDDGIDTPLAVAILGKGGTDWKWYGGYEWVAAHEKIFAYFEELYENYPNERPYNLLSGAFARIGEDVEDTVTQFWGNESYGLLAVQRTIDCPYDSEEKPDLRASLSKA